MPRTTGSSHAIMQTLADGTFHSGEQLAQHLRISRSAVWKHVHELQSRGLEIHSVPGRGYRLATRVELLDAARLRRLLTPAGRKHLHSLTVLDKVGSTNTWLMAETLEFPAVCLAEWQTAGRGRRGRQWVSPFAANLYMSLGWQFDDLPPGFTALAMVAAVAAVRALRELGISGLAIKWPNDLVAEGKKLGGILVDMQGEPPGRVRAVVGLGINVRMPINAAAHIDQAWTDLATYTPEHVPERNHLAAVLIEELLRALAVFARRGFDAFVEDWRALDLAAGREVHLHHQHQVINGTSLGVDQDGALLLNTEIGTRRFVSGDLSLSLSP